MRTSDDSFIWEKKPTLRDELGFRRPDNDLDDDMVMIKAAVALRRANRFTELNKNETEYGFPSKSDNHSISGMNISELPWQPVGMSTPFTIPPMRPRAFGSSCDNEHDQYDSKDPFGNSNIFSRNDKSDVFRTSNYDNSVYQSRNGTKKLSPVMEDVLRRRDILKASLKEGKIM
jgi:hypothetical protein